MDSDSDIESNSVFALDLDAESEADVDSSQNENEAESSETSSTNDITDLLEDLDSSSDEIRIEPATDEQENEDEIDQEDDYDASLSIDLDGLANDERNPDEMFDKINCDPEWSQNFSDVHVRQFRGDGAANLPQDFDVNTATPLEYFQLFFTNNVLETIVENTNKFQQFRCDQKRVTKPEYEEKFWQDTNLSEIKAYFGISIVFGILNQPRYRNFWSKDPFLGNPGVQRVFSLKRYSKLSEYLHVSDRASEKPRGHPAYDKLGKIRFLYNHLKQVFPIYKNCEREQVITLTT